MPRFRNLFGSKKCNVIGMIHIGALPGEFKNVFYVYELQHLIQNGIYKLPRATVICYNFKHSNITLFTIVINLVSY